MAHMSPLNWLNLFMLFIFSYFLFLLFNYYNFMVSKKNNHCLIFIQLTDKNYFLNVNDLSINMNKYLL